MKKIGLNENLKDDTRKHAQLNKTFLAILMDFTIFILLHFFEYHPSNVYWIQFFSCI